MRAGVWVRVVVLVVVPPAGDWLAGLVLLFVLRSLCRSFCGLVCALVVLGCLVVGGPRLPGWSHLVVLGCSVDIILDIYSTLDITYSICILQKGRAHKRPCVPAAALRANQFAQVTR